MNANEVRFQAAAHDELLAHLFTGEAEQVAFGFASWKCSPEGMILSVDRVRPIPGEELAHQSAFHVRLDDDAQAAIILEGFTSGCALVEFHSHRSDLPACFSASDQHGFAEFVPHVQWRLPGRPYAAVVCHEGSFDGLLWPPGCPSPVQLSGMRIEGRGLLNASCRTLGGALGRTRRSL